MSFQNIFSFFWGICFVSSFLFLFDLTDKHSLYGSSSPFATSNTSRRDKTPTISASSSSLLDSGSKVKFTNSNSSNNNNNNNHHSLLAGTVNSSSNSTAPGTGNSLASLNSGTAAIGTVARDKKLINPLTTGGGTPIPDRQFTDLFGTPIQTRPSHISDSSIANCSNGSGNSNSATNGGSGGGHAGKKSKNVSFFSKINFHCAHKIII